MNTKMGENLSTNENRLGLGVVVLQQSTNPGDQAMDGRIHLKPCERETWLDCYRKSNDLAVRLRAHILLLLDDGHPWSRIHGML